MIASGHVCGESKMTGLTRFKPKASYVTYIDAVLEQVWQALIDPAATKQYFFGFAVEML